MREQARREGKMASSISLLFLLAVLHIATVFAINIDNHNEIERKSVGRRGLLSFKEHTRGTNVTFDCSPSGPCVPCLYSEKKDDKFRCSETGYRIPFQCEEAVNGTSQTSNVKKTRKERSTVEISLDSAKPHDATRSLLEDSGESKSGSQGYITFRSCIPAVNEEKMSVMGFEAMMLGLLLISGTVVYVRRKRTAPMLGVSLGRVQSNSRF